MEWQPNKIERNHTGFSHSVSYLVFASFFRSLRAFPSMIFKLSNLAERQHGVRRAGKNGTKINNNSLNVFE